jgi:DNA-binding CsgD family transcriptional regulator
MLENYNKARRYLYKIDPNTYKDVLHDAYLTYYRRTGLNLFERSNGNVIGVVKNQYFENYRKGTFRRNGERLPYQFSDFDDHSCNKATPLDLMIAEETRQKLYSRVDSFKYPHIAREILELREQGYQTKEIAEMVNLDMVTVNGYTRNLQKDRKFTGNKTKPHEIDEIKRLSKSGLTLEQIRRKTGRSMKTIWKILNNKLK